LGDAVDRVGLIAENMNAEFKEQNRLTIIILTIIPCSYDFK